jgi:Zn finger protein HypA/HybF involved in hydrogenase expression
VTTAGEYIEARTSTTAGWRAVLEYNDLDTDARKEVEARTKRGLRSDEPRVRALAWSVIEDAVVACMDTTPITTHMQFELEAVDARGEPLQDGERPPGCTCADCTGILPGPTHAPDLSAVCCPLCGSHRELVRDNAVAFYLCARCYTRSAAAWPRRELGSLWDDLARTLARPARPRHEPRDVLDIGAARRVHILDAVRRLGFTVNERRPWIACPFHSDTRPSLHINVKKDRAFCNPCGRSWDAIAFTMEVRHIGFADAVKELAA